MSKNLFFVLLLLIQTTVSCQISPTKGESYDPPNSTDTRTKQIDYQVKTTYKIQDIYISNEFLGARLDNAIDGGRDTIIVSVSPENAPINKSAWFAFKVWSDTNKKVTIKLTYQNGGHRYIPKISQDGATWAPIYSSRFRRDRNDKNAAWLEIDVTSSPTWVTAQELMTSKEIFDWMDSWAQRKSYVSNETIGESRLNAPMRLMTIKETDEKNVLILIGRQHPPEITGQVAMHTFIETILDDSELSQNFRKKFQVYSFPLMNPDGVDQGHWRHNTGGIDLNRDWEKYRQPEVKTVVKYLKKEMSRNKYRVWYGLDFHSTGADILYPIDPKIITEDKSITYPWIKSMNERLPNAPWVVEPYDLSSPICKNWIFRTFGAEAVTYEVGDEVARDYVKLKAKIAAEEMMRILLKRLAAEGSN